MDIKSHLLFLWSHHRIFKSSDFHFFSISFTVKCFSCISSFHSNDCGYGACCCNHIFRFIVNCLTCASWWILFIVLDCFPLPVSLNFFFWLIKYFELFYPLPVFSNRQVPSLKLSTRWTLNQVSSPCLMTNLEPPWPSLWVMNYLFPHNK